MPKCSLISCTSFDDKRADRALSTFFLHASPFTIATLAIAFWSWDSIVGAASRDSPIAALDGNSDQTSLAAMAQVVFIGLSAVTVPHMIITEISQVLQRAMGSPERKSSAVEMS